jgi:hypothetical protein
LQNIFIIDQNEGLLRSAGFLPTKKAALAEFEGVPVYALDSGKYFNTDWFYESNLPSREGLALAISNYQMDWEITPTIQYSLLVAARWDSTPYPP